MSLPGEKNDILSLALCEDTSCPDINLPGQVLPLTSTPRVSSENVTNAGNKCASLGKLETFGKPNYSIPCNCIMGPIEEKELPSPIAFPAQSIIEPSCEPLATAPPDEPLNCPRLVLMAKGQPQ